MARVEVEAWDFRQSPKLNIAQKLQIQILYKTVKAQQGLGSTRTLRISVRMLSQVGGLQPPHALHVQIYKSHTNTRR